MEARCLKLSWWGMMETAGNGRREVCESWRWLRSSRVCQNVAFMNPQETPSWLCPRVQPEFKNGGVELGWPNGSSGKRAPLFGFGRLSIASLRVIAVCRTFRGRVLCFPSYEITRCARTYAWFGCCLRMSCTGGTHRAVIPRVSGKSARFLLCVPAVRPSLNSPPVSQRESAEPKPSAPAWLSVLPLNQTQSRLPVKILL